MADTPENDAAPPAELDEHTAKLAGQGFAIEDGLPHNHRLRAEVLAKRGLAEDPAGIIAPDQIAATTERLEAEEAERVELERKTKAETPSMSWSRERLATHATGMGLAVETDANKAAILAMIQGADPAPTNEG